TGGSRIDFRTVVSVGLYGGFLHTAVGIGFARMEIELLTQGISACGVIGKGFPNFERLLSQPTAAGCSARCRKKVGILARKEPSDEFASGRPDRQGNQSARQGTQLYETGELPGRSR